MKKKYIVAGILAAAGVICAAVSIYLYFDQKSAGDEYEKLRKKVTVEDNDDTDASDKTPVDVPIDFAQLKSMNPDIYAWIKVPGTVIDYPVVQSDTDNTYYLDHSVEKEEDKAGAIFTEDYNSKTFLRKRKIYIDCWQRKKKWIVAFWHLKYLPCV